MTDQAKCDASTGCKVERPGFVLSFFFPSLSFCFLVKVFSHQVTPRLHATRFFFQRIMTRNDSTALA